MVSSATPFDSAQPKAPGFWGWLLRFGLLTALLLLYSYVIEKFGGMSALWWNLPHEGPLLFYLYYLLTLLMPAGRMGAALAGVPIVIVYLLMDTYFFLFGRVFRLTELKELPELIDILPLSLSIPIGLIFILLLVGFVWVMRIRKPARLLVFLLPMVGLISLLVAKPDLFLKAYSATSVEVVEWSEEENLRWNGRLWSIFYEEAKRRAALLGAEIYVDRPEYQQHQQARLAALSSVEKKPNVHLVVMEGFVDAARLSKLKLNQDPLHPKFRALLAGGKGYLSRSPVYGGYTAQAEFEILCGTPALQVLGTIEFNRFSGAPVNCVPEVLRQAGYRTLYSEGYKPEFFNKVVAAVGLGFDERNFPKEYAPGSTTYLTTGDVVGEKFMFDSVLLQQNLDYVRKHLAEQPDKPLLNYILTIYGHFPYRVNEKLRPKVISVESPSRYDPELVTVLNMAYHRSLALAEYVEQLSALDPEGLIILISDHLPPVPEGMVAYARLGYLGNVEGAEYQTLVTAFQGGKALPLEQMHHYDIPRLIYDQLSQGKYCESAVCQPRSPEQLREDYLQLMSHAVLDVD